MSNHLPWFRLYSELPHDERIEEIAFEDRWHYINILCMKCSGILDKEYQNDKMRERKIARELGVDTETAEFVCARLVEVGLIDDAWQPTGWDKRQFSSDSSTGRVRKYRESKKKKTENGNVTGVKRYSNGTESEADTDSEAESTDDNSAQAREEIHLDELETKLRQVAGDSTNTAAPNLCVMSEPLGWIGAGFDLDLDILPTIRTVAKRVRKKHRIQAWGYFTQAIADAHARRTKPVPAGDGTVEAEEESRPLRDPATFTVEDWQKRLERYWAGEFEWPVEILGASPPAKPGDPIEPGCMVPAKLLDVGHA